MTDEGLTENNPLFELAPDAYYLNDLRGNFINGNHAAEELTGYRKDEIIGKSFLKVGLLPTLQLPKAAVLLARNALGQSTGPDEFTLIHKDGSQVQVEISTRPVKYKEQTIVLGIARKISERKHAQKELKYRIEIEKVVNQISARFITLSSETMDEDINYALKKIGEFINIDSCRVLLISDDAKNLRITHEWRAPGIKFQGEVSTFSLDSYPWANKKLSTFENIYISCGSDLPPEAGVEKQKLLQQGMESVAAIPMVHGKSLAGFMILISATKERSWPEEDLALLRTVADIVVYALENKKTEEALKKRAEELERMNKFMVGRELTIIELKNEINLLLENLGQPIKYRHGNPV
jgi:PAS domain S-box-containing protein